MDEKKIVSFVKVTCCGDSPILVLLKNNHYLHSYMPGKYTVGSGNGVKTYLSSFSSSVSIFFSFSVNFMFLPDLSKSTKSFWLFSVIMGHVGLTRHTLLYLTSNLTLWQLKITNAAFHAEIPTNIA